MKLRSARWFDGDDEVGLLHRVALSSSGVEFVAGKPVVGIANSASDLNPCNKPLSQLVSSIKKGIIDGGGTPVEFPTISLGEDLMKPSAMLYRNLLSIEIEEMIRANPLDGLVILANCDKSVPGALMGAISADLPTVLVTGGARAPAIFNGRRIGTGTDLWRLSEQHRVGNLRAEEWSELEKCLGCSSGACNTMGTASTMAILCETLGFMVPSSSTIPTHDPAALESAKLAGEAAVGCVQNGITPSQIFNAKSLANAIKVLHAIGGSTNAVIHLAALAGRAGLNFSLDDVATLGSSVPVLVDVEPSGSGLMQDFHEAGGVPVLLKELESHLDTATRTVRDQSLKEIIEDAGFTQGAIRPSSNPLRNGGCISVVRGSLAPDGAIIKTSAASPQLMKHVGPALVFEDYQDMMGRIDDPTLKVTADSVLVLRGCGPVGVPGMPEWGMIPIPAKLVAQGVSDIVRITDSRMSGTSFGTVVLHVAPEGAIGGPISLVKDDDIIELDVGCGKLDLLISPDELSKRVSEWTNPPLRHTRGWPALYVKHVLQAPSGCDFDFLRATNGVACGLVEPVIGRS